MMPPAVQQLALVAVPAVGEQLAAAIPEASPDDLEAKLFGLTLEDCIKTGLDRIRADPALLRNRVCLNY